VLTLPANPAYRRLLAAQIVSLLGSGLATVALGLLAWRLADEEEYTQALSLSRLAYDVESLASPLLAAALMSVVSFPFLFAGTVIGFLVSAAFVLSVKLPAPSPGVPRTIWERTTSGLRIYLATPRLRGLLALSLSVSAAGTPMYQCQSVVSPCCSISCV